MQRQRGHQRYLRVPIGQTEYRSRLRLLTHLSDTRVRSKVRSTSCNADFIASNPKRIDAGVLAELHKRDRMSRNAAIKLGHTHELASVPCQRSRPSVLKGVRGKQATASETVPAPSSHARRRLRVKTSPSDCEEFAMPHRKRRRISQKSRPD